MGVYDASKDIVLNWKLVDDSNPRFNVWETTNTFIYEWKGVGNKLLNTIYTKDSYRECFPKRIDPNEKRYIRMASQDRMLLSLEEVEGAQNEEDDTIPGNEKIRTA